MSLSPPLQRVLNQDLLVLLLVQHLSGMSRGLLNFEKQ